MNAPVLPPGDAVETGRSPVARFYPILVQPFQLVSKSDLLRLDIARSGIAYLETVSVMRNLHAGQKIYNFIAKAELFDDDGRRRSIGPDGLGVNYGDAAHCRKPQPAVFRCVLGEAPVFQLHQPFICAEPKTACAVLADRPDSAFEKSVFIIGAFEAPVLEIGEPKIRAGPQPAGVVFVDARNSDRGQALRNAVVGETASLKLIQSVVPRAYPDCPRTILEDRVDPIRREPFPLGKESYCRFARSMKPHHCANPYSAFMIFIEPAWCRCREQFTLTISDPIQGATGLC